jgi:toxin ParE1/3/4
MRLELSCRAQVDLDDIRDFSVERFGPERAIAYLDAVEQAFRRIVDFPAIGAPQLSLSPATRSLVCQRHRIYYVPGDDTVLIVRILHQAMDVEGQL